jgi:uncharacterized membrane protein YcaP (DUF421 family)
MLLALTKVIQQVMGWASSVFTSACTALLCWFVLILFMCLLVQHDSRWRHVQFSGMCIGYMLGICFV